MLSNNMASSASDMGAQCHAAAGLCLRCTGAAGLWHDAVPAEDPPAAPPKPLQWAFFRPRTAPKITNM